MREEVDIKMPETKRILWIDNDQANIRAFVNGLREAGYTVDVVTSVSAAEELLVTNRFDLLILDIMIPTMSEKEEEKYPPDETDNGHSTGLLFLKRLGADLVKAGTVVMAFTVRVDKGILRAFEESGLPRSQFVTKMEVREWADFLRKVEELLKLGKPGGAG
jgi:CheY-like chemotaxis protein